MGGNEIHDQSSTTDAEAGVVIVDGPDGVAISMTPRAASETGDKLKASAQKAEDQRAGKRPPFEPDSSPDLRRN